MTTYNPPTKKNYLYLIIVALQWHSKRKSVNNIYNDSSSMLMPSIFLSLFSSIEIYDEPTFFLHYLTPSKSPFELEMTPLFIGLGKICSLGAPLIFS